MVGNAEPQAQSSKGFALIELLVVITIIAILAVILFPVFTRAQEEARQTLCLANVKQCGWAPAIPQSLGQSMNPAEFPMIGEGDISGAYGSYHFDCM